MGRPARVLRPVDEEMKASMAHSAEQYVQLADLYGDLGKT